MKTRTFDAGLGIAIVAGVLVGAMPVRAHHSFAMYDQTVTKTVTGKLTRFVVGGNHSQLIFEVLGDDGKTSVDQKTGKTTTTVLDSTKTIPVKPETVKRK